jgi:Protein of unknown function (DUF4058)
MNIPGTPCIPAGRPDLQTCSTSAGCPRNSLLQSTRNAETSLEIDVATFAREPRPAEAGNTNGPATLAPAVWTPPAAERTLPALFPATFEVRVFQTRGSRTLVGAIELISPGNKDRADKRQAFVAQCASYLQEGVSVVLIDIVTDRRANLHNETMRFLNAPSEVDFATGVDLYAAAYRPVERQDRPELDLWRAGCKVGEPLPVMPLRPTGDLFVPVDFEAANVETCRRRRLM